MSQVLPLWYYCITTIQTPETIESNYGESEDAHVTEGHVRCAIQSLFIKHLTINIEGRCDFFIFRCPLEKVVRATGWLFKYLQQQSLEGMEQGLGLQPIEEGASKYEKAFQKMLQKIIDGQVYWGWTFQDEMLPRNPISPAHQCFRHMVALGLETAAERVWTSMDNPPHRLALQGDLSLAAGEGHIEIIRDLFEKGACVLGDWNRSDMAGSWNPVHFAAYHGQVAALEVLCSTQNVVVGDDVSTFSTDNTQTYFQAAAYGGAPEAPGVIRTLVRHRNDPNAILDDRSEVGLAACLGIGVTEDPEIKAALIEEGCLHTSEDYEAAKGVLDGISISALLEKQGPLVPAHRRGNVRIMGQVLPLWYHCITAIQTVQDFESNYKGSENASVTEGHIRDAIRGLFSRHLTDNVEARCDFFISCGSLEKVVRATGWLFKYLNQQSEEGLQPVGLQPVEEGASKRELAFQKMLQGIIDRREYWDSSEDLWGNLDYMLPDITTWAHQCFRDMVALGFEKEADRIWTVMKNRPSFLALQGDLSLAAGEGHIGLIKYLFRKGANVLGDPNHLNMAGMWNPVHFAAYKGQVAAVELLCSTQDTAVNDVSTFSTPFTQTYFQAAVFGKAPEAPEVVRCLAKHGHDINLVLEDIDEFGLGEILPIAAATGSELRGALIECGAYHTLEDRELAGEVLKRNKRSAEEAGASSSSASKRQR